MSLRKEQGRVARLFLEAFFLILFFFSCVSPQGGNTENLSDYSQKEEQSRKELEKRRQKKQERQKEERAKRQKEREKARKAKIAAQKKHWEQLERERQNRAKREEEKRRQAEEKRKQEEDRRKAQERDERRKKKKRIVRKIKELYEGESFWAKDAGLLGKERILVESKRKGQVALYENPRRLQLQALTYSKRRYALKLGNPIPIQKGQFDLTPILLARRGNFLLLSWPVLNTAFGRPLADSFCLFQIQLQGRYWSLLNIYSDGEDLLRLDLESVDERRLYRRVIVEELLLSP